MKRLLLILAFLIFSGFTAVSNAQNSDIEVLPVLNAKSACANRIWVGTFQIVWNEFTDNIVKRPVYFVRYRSKTAKELNKQMFKKDYISDNSYYTTYGVVSPELKEKISKAILEKFNEKSDILDAFDWSYAPNKMFVYAMLKKDFKFLTPFDKLSEGKFAKSNVPVEYFGIKEESSSDMYDNVEVLFYNSTEDFAVKLLTQTNDEVILYRTNDDLTLDKYYADLKIKKQNYKGEKDFKRFDRLKVPYLNIYQNVSFPELEGKRIKGTNIVIDKTIETIDFKMDNEGVKLKSEAGIMARLTSLAPPIGRYFIFNDSFVLYLKEKNQEVPYFAMRVDDAGLLNKTGKNNK